MKRYGVCERCETPLNPIWFEEDEYKVTYGSLHKTGRIRRAVSHLECPYCGKRYIVDDSFDVDWYYRR